MTVVLAYCITDILLRCLEPPVAQYPLGASLPFAKMAGKMSEMLISLKRNDKLLLCRGRP